MVILVQVIFKLPSFTKSVVLPGTAWGIFFFQFQSQLRRDLCGEFLVLREILKKIKIFYRGKVTGSVVVYNFSHFSPVMNLTTGGTTGYIIFSILVTTQACFMRAKKNEKIFYRGKVTGFVGVHNSSHFSPIKYFSKIVVQHRQDY